MPNGDEVEVVEAPQSLISNLEDELIRTQIWMVIADWNASSPEQNLSWNSPVVQEIFKQYYALYGHVDTNPLGLGVLSNLAYDGPESEKVEKWVVEAMRSVILPGVTFEMPPSPWQKPPTGEEGTSPVQDIVREEQAEAGAQANRDAGQLQTDIFPAGSEVFPGSNASITEGYFTQIERLYGRLPNDAEKSLIRQLTVLGSAKDVLEQLPSIANLGGPRGEAAAVFLTINDIGTKGYRTPLAQGKAQLEELLTGRGLSSEAIEAVVKGYADPATPWGHAAYRAESKREPSPIDMFVDPLGLREEPLPNPSTKLEYGQWLDLQVSFADALEPYKADMREKAATDAAEKRLEQITEGIEIAGDFSKMIMTAFNMPGNTADVFNKLGGESAAQYLARITRYLDANAHFFEIAEDASTIFAGIVPEDFEFPSEFTGPELYEFLLGAGVISFADLPMTTMPDPEQVGQIPSQQWRRAHLGMALAGFPAGPFVDETGTNVITSQQAATAADREALEREQEEFDILQGFINEGLTEGDLEQQLGFLQDMPVLLQLLEAQFAAKKEQFEAETATAQEFASQTLTNLQNVTALNKQLAAKQQEVIDPTALDFAAQQKALNQEIKTLQGQIGFAESIGADMTPGGVVQPTTGPMDPAQALAVGQKFPMAGLVGAITGDQTFGGFIQQNFGTLAQQFRERRLETAGPPALQPRRSRRTIFTA